MSECERIPLLVPSEPTPAENIVLENAVLDAARDSLMLGWQPIPIPARSKIPDDRKGWENERWTVEDVPRKFSPHGNVGVLTGEPSHGLIDLDLDCAEAVALAPAFLPATGFKSGRASNPLSHYWYTTNPAPEYMSFRDVDCTPQDPHGKKLLELRSTGQQTIVPPSIHPLGEQLVWHEANGAPATVTGQALCSATRALAAASLLLRHYPETGERHDFFMSFSGFLLNQGWNAQRVSHFVETVAKAKNDDEWQDRVTCVETTAQRVAAGEKILGGVSLRETWDRATFDRFCKFLGFSAHSFSFSSALPTIEADCVSPEPVPLWPVYTLEGDYLSDLTYLLYAGTSIPPQFLREQIIAVLAALADGRLGFPNHERMPVRRFLALISERAQAGKGESWKRIASNLEGALRPLIETHGLKLLNGSGIGSGQFLAKELQDNPNALCHFDESSQLFEITGQQCNTLFSALKSLFESNSHWTGSFANRKHGGDDLHLSVLLHSTLSTFLDGFAHRRGIGDGLLSRFTLVYSNSMPVVPEWQPRNFTEERTLVATISNLLPQVHTVPTIANDARERFNEFARMIYAPDHPNPDHARRVLELVKIDILHRCVYSGSAEITLPMVERGIVWGEHQLALRLAFWPMDAKSEVSGMTQVLLRRLHKGSASLRDLRTAANVYRDGSHETFARCLTALRRSGEVVILGKNAKGQDVYGFADPEVQP